MKKRLIDIVIIVLIGLLPLLWLPGQTLLLGHDAGIPFDPYIHFLDRLTTWTQRFGTGTDQSFALLGALFIHGPEALLIWLGFSVKMQQLILFSFWFLLPGLTMYYFTYKVWPEKRYLPLIASVIYMLNFYLLQAWFVAERTKFSIYAVVPLLVYFASAYLLNKISWKKSIIATGLIFFFFNGGGSVPLYGGLFIIFFILFAYINYIHRSKAVFRRTIIYIAGAAVTYVLLNAYWIFPYINYLLNSFSTDLAAAGGPEGALTWSSYLSTSSNFLNLFRGQGIPDWYLNVYHPYSWTILTNKFFIVLSFAFPLLALASLLLVKDKKDKFYIYLLVLIVLVTLIFMSGPKSQLGFIYEFMVQHIPGFAIFRSNYYKFGYAFWFSYSILIAFTLNIVFTFIRDWLRKRNVNVSLSVYLLPVLFIVGYVFYHYPVLTGKFLDYSNEPGKELTNRVAVPQYVFDYGKWMNMQDTSRRYLVAPELNESGFISYDWKYWSSAPVSSLQTKNSFVQNTLLIPIKDRILIKHMYDALLEEDIATFTDFTEVFAIDGIVVHEDFDWQNISTKTTDPKRYSKILDTNPNFKLVKVFGKWKVYDIVNRERSLRVTASPKLNFLQGELVNVMSFPNFDPTSPIFMADEDPSNSSYFAGESAEIYLTPKCINCDFSQLTTANPPYNPTVLPGSIFYPLIKQREEKIKAQSVDFESQVNYYLATSNRRLAEVNWMISSRQKVDYLQQTFDAYKENMQSLRALVAGEWKVNGENENNLATTINFQLADQLKVINAIFDHTLLNAEHRKSLALAYDELHAVQKYARGKEWHTETIGQKKYLLDLPKPGDYEVHVKKNSLTDMNGDYNQSNITFVTNNASLRPISETEGWIYFGKSTLSDKQTKLVFSDSTQSNLLDKREPEYPDGNSGITQVTNTFAMLTSGKCFTYTVPNVIADGKHYLVSFEYRNFTSEKELSYYTSTNEEIVPQLRIKEALLDNSLSWKNHNEVITPLQNNIKLNFCNNFDILNAGDADESLNSDAQLVSEIKNITLNEIVTPIIILHQKQKDIQSKNFVTSFEKPNAVTYNVQVSPIKEPVTLVMRETYGKAWQLCDKDKKCIANDDKHHFNSAGLTNGWYLKDGLNGNVTLSYTAEKTFTTGVYVTLGTLLLIVGGIVWTKLRKK